MCFSCLLVFTLQGRVSATTTQIASLCYKLATTALSLVLFPEAQRDLGLLALMGYGLSTVSVALYAFWPKSDPVVKKAEKPPQGYPRSLAALSEATGGRQFAAFYQPESLVLRKQLNAESYRVSYLGLRVGVGESDSRNMCVVRSP
eukprot:s250_g12.t1